MADHLTPQQRSYAMSRIRSRANASTELRLVGLLKQAKIVGWRRHVRMLGNPDFAFRRERVLVFVDGCFWHGCPRCGLGSRSNQEYWSAKIARNMARDRRNTKALRAKGWTVLRVWEHSFKRPARIVRTIRIALGIGLSRL